MSETLTTGTPAADHHLVPLRGVDGNAHSIASLAGEAATVVLFTANGCPTARAYQDRLVALQNRWDARGVRLIAVNSNNPYLSPPDTFDEMVRRSSEWPIKYPYLKDEDGGIAKGYGAICTPHAFVLGPDLRVGDGVCIDDSRLGDRIKSHDLEEALGEHRRRATGEG